MRRVPSPLRLVPNTVESPHPARTSVPAAASGAGPDTAELEQLRDAVAEVRRENAELKRRRKFGLVWEDQPEERIEAEMRSRLPLLRHLPSLDVAGARPAPERPHVLIEGDNLHALTVLQATHKGAIDVIYIDPPYNTGQQDFRYNDRFVEKEDSYRHSAWLSFMSRRLRLARTLLTEKGIITISIDENEQAHLRLLCDQVFGERNFVAQLIWAGKSGGQDAKAFNRLHEYVLVYARSKEHARVRPGTAAVEDKKYPKLDVATGRRYRLQLARKWGSNSLREDRPNLWYPVTAPDGSECWPLHGDGTEGCWRWSSTTFAHEVGEGNVEFARDSDGNWVPYQRMWAPEDGQETRPRSTMLPPEVGTTSTGSRELKALLGRKNGFDYPKPTALLTWLLQACAGPDATVLDFFAGSGSTAHAVAMLNAADNGTRQCILVTNNENNIARGVTQPRLKATFTGRWADGNHEPLPGSLQFFTTDLLRKARSRDAMRMKVATALTDLLAVKENCYTVTERAERYAVLTNGTRTVVLWTALFDDAGLPELLAAIELTGAEDRVLYACSAGLFGPDQALIDLTTRHPNWRVEALPGPYLDELEKAQTAAARRPR